jgi:hypothetical protein
MDRSDQSAQHNERIDVYDMCTYKMLHLTKWGNWIFSLICMIQKIAYVKYYEGDHGVPHLYDMTTGIDMALISEDCHAGNIVLYGNNIVWDLTLGWSADSWLTVYSLVTKPTADLTANVTSGKAPL